MKFKNSNFNDIFIVAEIWQQFANSAVASTDEHSLNFMGRVNFKFSFMCTSPF
jgi:hypothetical protein